MRIVVGTKNPIKVRGVELAFRRMGFSPIEVVSIPVETSVGPQPIGLKRTILGALERATKSLSKISNAKFSVGLEAGLIEFPGTITGFINQQIAAVVDRNDRVSLGLSAAFEFPPIAVKKVLRGEVEELETVMIGISGIESIGNSVGAIGYLTDGCMTRLDLCFQAVLTALIPRRRPDLYPSLPRVSEVRTRILESLT